MTSCSINEPYLQCLFVSNFTQATSAVYSSSAEERVAGTLPCAWEVLGDSNSIDSLADENTVILPLADVEKLVRDHADHLGPQLRNTKYITPEVRAQRSCHLWTVQAYLSWRE